MDAGPDRHWRSTPIEVARTAGSSDCHRAFDDPQITKSLAFGWQTHVVINSLVRCLRQLELDGSTCLPLPDGRSIRGIATRRDIINFEGYEIATT